MKKKVHNSESHSDHSWSSHSNFILQASDMLEIHDITMQQCVSTPTCYVSDRSQKLGLRNYSDKLSIRLTYLCRNWRRFCIVLWSRNPIVEVPNSFQFLSHFRFSPIPPRISPISQFSSLSRKCHHWYPPFAIALTRQVLLLESS